MAMVTRIGLITLALGAAAASQDATTLEPPREALVFKSGQSFLYREVALEATTTRARLRLPPALHGTVWLASEGFDIRGARASRSELMLTREVQNLGQALRMAAGKEVQVEVTEGREVASITGKILRLLGPVAEVPAGSELEPASPTTVVLAETLQGQKFRTRVLPLSRIVGLSLLEDAGTDPWTYAASVKVPVLDVELGARSEGRKVVGLSCLSDGLSWAPSYVLHLAENGRARLVGKAVLMNDLEDLVKTRVRLVVGFPNLKFAGVQSALLPETSIDQFRRLLTGEGQAGRQVIQTAMSQIMSNDLGILSEPAQPRGPAVPTPGEAAEDLYVYDVGTHDLARGERAYMPLLETEVPFSHRFDWDVPDRVDRYARFVEQPDDRAIPLWHVLKLENTGQAPWTTAPVLIQGDKGPLAQSQLDYTPPGTDTVIQLTKALNLVGEAVEVRVGDGQAPRDEVRLFGRRYELIQVKGQLELTHRGQRTAPVRVRKQFSGDLLTATGDPKVQGKAKGLGQVNASRELTWEFQLEPGQTWKADYEYEVLINR